ncbi:rhodanese-like domain-containing protein [Immundisolibacter sp.]|jgi:rhodanese-related sulfurtransferase|uniref:rhodanese-like domain-containing protein n=1 Tax=Immundisolibacter sp. TaxID=1934948 RepID=UPI002B146A16|nr:rhodanese-like domain-containing protein [Immundisolibacter sp.]MEA3219459.1 Thiosulfate sulfurtransferase GlpE [Immundisolibacter sp.]
MAFVLANIELFAAFAAVAALLGLSYSLEGMLGYQPTLPGDAVRLMNAGASVLDLRPSAEFAAGHVRGAVNVAPDALAEWAAKQRKTKPRAVLLIAAPRQSVLGPARLLRAQGFEPVHVLKGGMRGWAEAQLPLAK